MTAIGKIIPKTAQILAKRADVFNPLRLMRVIIQNIPTIILMRYVLLFASVGFNKYAAVPAINNRAVGYQTRVLIHCIQIPTKAKVSPNAKSS